MQKRPKISPSDPIAAQFRPIKDYIELMGDVFVTLAKKNPKPHDWAVLSRVFGHLAVRGFEAGYKTHESVDLAVALGQAVGDQTFRVAQSAFSKIPKTTRAVPDPEPTETEKFVEEHVDARHNKKVKLVS